MGTSIFGGGPADITTDSTGTVVGGTQLKVYTAANGGQLVTELYDLDDQPLPGAVVSQPDGEDEGRIAFKASDSYDQLFMDSGNGSRWIIPSREVFTSTSLALSKSEKALDVASEAYDKADEASHKVDSFENSIGGMAHLDVAMQAPKFVTTLQPDGLQIVQCVARDRVTGDFYCSQSINMSPSQEAQDLRITRMSPAGETISSMRMNGGGHGDTIGLENRSGDIYIWFCWEEDLDGGNPDFSLVRVRYSDGARVHRTDGQVEQVVKFDGDSEAKVTIGLDWEHDRIATRIAAGYRTSERYTLRRISDVLKGRNDRLAEISLDDDHGLTQSHTTLGDYLYVYRGKDPDLAREITRYSWTTRAEYAVDVTDLGADRNGRFPGDEAVNESEGITTFQGRDGRSGLLFNKGMGDIRARICPVWSIAPAGVETGMADAFESTHRAIQAGWVEIPGGSGSPSFVHVSFKWTYPGIPMVTASPDTTVPGTHVLGCGVANVTATGFDLYVTRTNSSITGAYWIAYYGPGLADGLVRGGA